MLALVAAVAMLLPQGMSAADIFDDLADMPAVESTYISGRFAGNYRQWNMSSHSLNLTMGFSSLYAYDCMSEKSVEKARQLLDSYRRRHPELEVMMRTRQGQGEYMVLEQFGKNDKKVYKWVIWDSSSPASCEIVVINWKNGYLREQDR